MKLRHFVNCLFKLNICSFKFHAHTSKRNSLFLCEDQLMSKNTKTIKTVGFGDNIRVAFPGGVPRERTRKTTTGPNDVAHTMHCETHCTKLTPTFHIVTRSGRGVINV